MRACNSLQLLAAYAHIAHFILSILLNGQRVQLKVSFAFTFVCVRAQRYSGNIPLNTVHSINDIVKIYRASENKECLQM